MSEPEVWNVMTLKDGQVSLLKNLTADECRAVVQRIRGDNPWSTEAIYSRHLASLGRDAQQRRMVNQYGSTIISFWDSAECVSVGWSVEKCEFWGSRDGTLEIWPKPDDYDARLAEAERVAAVVQATNAQIDNRQAA